jgi:creatinine amidohydrolase/Fe(II)-dependent formamide hydrolase-like protein
MSIVTSKWIPVVLLVLGCHAPGVFAQSAPGAAERLHANAVASFREARFREAYRQFVALADAGHAPSAELALWMHAHGRSVFRRNWDGTPAQLTAWAQLTGQPASTLVASSDPRTLVPVASNPR